MRADALAAVCPSTDGIAGAAVRHQAGAPPVLESCVFAPVEAGADRSAALARLVRARRLDTMACTSVIDLDQYALLLVEAPDVPPAELRAAMRWRVRDLIDFPVDEAVIDVFDAPAGGALRGPRMVYAVVARAAAVQRRADELLDAGLRLTAIDIPELVMRNLTALLPEDVGGVAFVYLAGEQGMITLTRQATLYLSRHIETGGDRLAQLEGETLSPEIEGWLDAVVIEVQRSLDYYDSHFSQPPIAGVVLAPHGGPVAAAAGYLGSQLGIPARVLDLNDLIDTAEALEPALQPQCLVAVGAALRVPERLQ